MRLLIAFVLLLLVTVSVALIVLHDPGYVLISYGVWTLETTLSFFLIALAVGYVVLYYLVHTLRGLWRLPVRVHDWRASHHRERSRDSFYRGMTELAEGRWKSAERHLVRSARYSEAPMLVYLGAARAAQQQGAQDRRDRYLHLAHESAPSAVVAVGLTQAQLQIAHEQLEQALATLTHLRSLEPRNTYVLRMLMKLYQELRDWEHLRDLLPELRKRDVLGGAQIAKLEARVYSELLRRAATSGDSQALRGAWEAIPKPQREDSELVLEYAKLLQGRGEGEEAEPLVRATLRRRWSDKLVHVYGLLDGDDPARQLAAAEAWAKDYGKNPVLLLTLGRLCLRNRLWGKARIYLESSIGAGPRAEAYNELGALLERMGDADAAMNCYREGMALAVSEGTYRFPEDADLSAEAEVHTEQLEHKAGA
jgi:HemY protein